MANKITITRKEVILNRTNKAIGTYPGQNRSRKFVNRKKQANKKACRGRVKE